MTTPNSAQERNAAAVDLLEDQASTSVRAAIAAMLADVLDAIGDLKDDATATAPTVEAVTAVARTAWQRVLDGIVAWVRETFGRLVTRAVANVPDDHAPDLPAETVESRVQSLMDQVRAGLDGVPDVLASRVSTQLREGYAAGESPAALRRRVADALDRDEWDDEVVRIARTTTTSVYNAAHSAAADALEAELGRPLPRMWLATRDTRTRETHQEANGQIVQSGETFRVGDARLRFPGDPLGPVSEIANCRCVVLPVVNDLVIDLAHRVQGREADVLDDIDTGDGQPLAAAALLATTRMPPQFVVYWTVGKGGGRIRWNSDGDFTRCTRALRKYLDPTELNGACANLHKLATGRWPAEKAATAAEEEGDMPCPCENLTDDELDAAAQELAAHSGPPAVITAASLDEARAGAMIALVPSEEDAARLVVDGDGAVPAGELHVTLAFLGEGAEWTGADDPESNAYKVLALAQLIGQDVAPITARIWGVAVTGGETDATPFYLLGDDTGRLAELQGGVLMAGSELLPPQHSPYVAHLSMRYGSADTEGMEAVGEEITLDRVRVAFGGEVTDYPLAGDDSVDLDEEDTEEEAAPAEEDPKPAAATADSDPVDEPEHVTAAADLETAPESEAERVDEPAPATIVADLRAASETMAVVAEAAANAPESPPGAWFVPVKVDGPTPPTVTAQGRVWGHIGQAGVCHAGIADECVQIPPTRTNFGAFHRGEIVTAEGDTVQVGYLYTGCDHSNLGMDLDEARDYLDASCTRTAAGRVYDTEFGPMFVGTILPGVTADAVARLHKLSGEWFTAPLELHAAVGVEDAGFPVDGTDPNGIRVSDTDPEPLTASAEQSDAAVVPAPREPVEVAAVVATHRKRAAIRSAPPAVIAARKARATRELARYRRRGA